MINWEKIAKERGFFKHYRNYETDEVNEPGDPQAMLVALYKEHNSIDGIAEALTLSRHTVRVAFERFDVPVKTQGGPQRRKFTVTEDILTECEERGIAAVAKDRELDYTTVYKATREPLRKRKLLRAESELSSSELLDEKGTQNHE